MKTLILLALLCSSALSAFVAKQSIKVSGVTYSIGNKGNDCGVTRTEDGKTISWYYTDGAANSDDCVGQNIFVLGSDVGVVLSINENQDIFTDENTASGDADDLLGAPLVGDAIVLGFIDTSSVSGTFGKFTLAFYDVAVDLEAEWPAPIEYVSAAACDDKKTIELTVNVESPYGVITLPFGFAEINGKGVKQVFNAEDETFTSYKPGDAPFCTKWRQPTAATKKDSGFAAWKLALIISLPCVAILIVVTIVLYIKTANKRKAAAATAKMEKFKQLPSSPTMTEEGGNQV